MAPVEPQLQAGVVFNEQALPKLQPNNDWYWIPSWYAGMKHLETQTIVQDYNFATGQSINPNRTVLNRQDLPIGFQADKNGQIWEFKRAPYSTTIEGGNTFTTTIVRSRDPVQVNQNSVVVKMIETSVVVDKRTRRILRTLQQEQINSFTPAGQGAMNLQTSIKSFGPNGAPQIQETSVRSVTQIAPFQPINVYQGMDLRSMFRDFMLAKGYGNLLPVDLAQTEQQNDQFNPQTAPGALQSNVPQQDTYAPSQFTAPSPPLNNTVLTDPSAPPVAPSR